VLFISGLGRSGSTLLELLLGGLPGVVAVGEVKHLWERGLRDNDLCGCGAPFHECPFWRDVGEQAFGGWNRVDPAAAIRAARAADRHRRLAGTLRVRRGSPLERYGETLERLFHVIRDVSGAEVVVDSSKDPPHGFVLRTLSGLDVRAVHLIRDSRGVTFSWSKAVARPDAANGAMMSRMSAAQAGLMWVDANLLTEALGGLGVPLVRVRYEDLVADPRAELRRIAAFAGLSATAVAVPGQATSDASRHGIGGNPIRFRPGQPTVRADDEWLRRMRPGDRRVVTGLTAVLLRRYGYPVLSPGETDASSAPRAASGRAARRTAGSAPPAASAAGWETAGAARRYGAGTVDDQLVEAPEIRARRHTPPPAS
jgi:hypothetical protein